MKYLYLITIGFHILTLSVMSTFAGNAEALNENDVREILHNLKSDPDGITHFGDDGVLRSYSSSGIVIDHARLTNEHLMLAARWLPSEKQDLMKKKWAGVDGFQARSEQIESPPSHLRPLLFEKPEAYIYLKWQMAQRVSRPRELQEQHVFWLIANDV
ncbi:hypothetical protein EMCG_03421 [[Emmonsia] crescens]|uniref:Uncharacterized protein n=1 Tax=[Emmonsia] crescens TaxID=73230 RepID=A0A0G2HV70_9EURO|nr:hypothetical protein EMCG_03421 [Emmonsia crescens UAMH 3008]